MHTIQNDLLTVQIASKGAELQSIYNNASQLEYLWNADAAFWAKKSPVLFPIVGGLKNNSYNYKGKTYHLGRHGFARDMEFEVTNQSASAITFTLKSNEETVEKYPFPFQFSISYSVEANELTVQYTVTNTGDEPMLFSVGAHPAFKIPLIEHTTFEDYYLLFNKTENASRFPLSAEGLIKEEPVNLLNSTNILPLQKSLFYEDAIVFKHLSSDVITIKTDKTEHGIKITFKDFPYMGIWNAKDADFICIEPWCGIADNVDASGELQQKEGINQLLPKEVFTRSWAVEVY